MSPKVGAVLELVSELTEEERKDVRLQLELEEGAAALGPLPTSCPPHVVGENALAPSFNTTSRRLDTTSRRLFRSFSEIPVAVSRCALDVSSLFVAASKPRLSVSTILETPSRRTPLRHERVSPRLGDCSPWDDDSSRRLDRRPSGRRKSS
jgi:hypothetical protein